MLRRVLRAGARLATLAGAAALAALLAVPRPAAADTEVDLALVIAVDISYSMDLDELALQRQGFADAFESEIVHDAIRRGALGRIAVAYVEWAGAYDQRLVIPWTVIGDPGGARAFADRVAAVPVRRAQRTSISGAIDFSARILAESGMDATRRVIDVSGDGPNNQGRLVEQARDEAVGNGIVINGLPLMLKRPGYLDLPDLDLYYRDCVIGGQGSFLVPVRDKAQFRDAVKTKIIREIADLGPPLVQKAQTSEKANCTMGEAQWRDRMGN